MDEKEIPDNWLQPEASRAALTPWGGFTATRAASTPVTGCRARQGTVTLSVATATVVELETVLLHGLLLVGPTQHYEEGCSAGIASHNARSALWQTTHGQPRPSGHPFGAAELWGHH